MARSKLILDRYKVIEQAGSGGYGTVFHAYDTQLKRDVAVKTIELSEIDAARVRLEAMEARFAAALDGASDGTEGVGAFPVRNGRLEGEGFGLPPSREKAVPVWSDNEPALPWSEIADELPWDATPEADIEARTAPGGAGGRASGEKTARGRHARSVPADAPVADGAPDDDLAGLDVLLSDDSEWSALAPAGAGTSLLPEKPDGNQGFSEDGGWDDGELFDPDDPEALFAHIPGLEEARTAAHLSDANIVTVYDCQVEGTTVYIIMEYVEGRTLRSLMDEMGDDITLDMVTAVFTSVAHAIRAAHKRKVLHLDIKPENVIVNGEGMVKVTDFGLATLTDGSGQGTAGGGTIGYMPLEQMRQEPLDVRTDEWALASMTYELLAGSNPFMAEELDAAEAAIEDAELVVPSLCWEDVDPALDDVLFRALDPNPEGRFGTVAQFSDALNPYLGDSRAGKKQLAASMAQPPSIEEEPEEEESAYEYRPRRSLVDTLGPAGGRIVGRVVSVLGASMMAAVALVNLPFGEGVPYGLATYAPLVFWIILALVAVVGALRPSIAAIASLTVLALSMILNGAWLLGLALAALSWLWWFYSARHSESACFCALLVPVGGAFGLAPLSAVAAGCLMDPRRAAASAAFSVVLALAMASMGSGDLWGWEPLVNLRFWSLDMQRMLVGIAMQPGTWSIAASWILAAWGFSLLCLKGSRAFDVVGAVLSCALLIAGVAGAAALDAEGDFPMGSAMAGAVIAGIAAVAAAMLYVPDRARCDADQWDEARRRQWEEG